jgi:gamma-glutamyltranspeptidase/glutathione hydrolase
MIRSLALMVLFLVPQDEETIGWQGQGRQGAVSAGGAGSVAAGIEILKAGGNAADGAAATLLALSVTDHTQFCFGSEVPILHFDAKSGAIEVIAGMGTAPKLATLEHFERRGGIPRSGLSAAAVPASLDATCILLARHGTMSFERVVGPTLRLLDRDPQGWRADLARNLRRMVEAEKGAEGDRARKIRAVQDFFYRGPIARELDAWMKENGGLIRYEDLAEHVTRIEKPVTAEYRGHTVVKCGPWTQGPFLLQTLRLLEGFDLKSMGHNSADAVHQAVEAMKLGFADRDVYYADPLFANVPLERLLSKEYADLRRPLIDPKKASLVHRPGDPLAMKPLLGEAETRKGLGGRPNDTTTCVVADKAGNVVAATPSGWSGVLAGSTGIWLGSRLQSLNTWKGHPNCIQPGKRPRITLTPTIVLKAGKPVLAVSVAGGDGQDQVTLQMILNRLDFGLPADRAVTAARFQTHHYVSSFGQGPPDLGSLFINAEAGERVIEELRSRGHVLSVSRGAVWHPSIIAIDPETGALHAAGDPRARRHAAAY